MKVDLKYSTLITDNQWDQNSYNYPTVYLGSESRKDEVNKLYKETLIKVSENIMLTSKTLVNVRKNILFCDLEHFGSKLTVLKLYQGKALERKI